MYRTSITQSRLKELLNYNPETGKFKWLTRRGCKSADSTAGNIQISENNRIVIRIDGQLYFAHRLAWLYMAGEWPESDIDHKDMDASNNKWNNLRLANKQNNGANRGKNKNNTSGYKGVTWAKRNKKWAARIMVDRKNISLGFFHDPEVAQEAYKKASKKYFGEFAQ